MRFKRGCRSSRMEIRLLTCQMPSPKSALRRGKAAKKWRARVQARGCTNKRTPRVWWYRLKKVVVVVVTLMMAVKCGREQHLHDPTRPASSKFPNAARASTNTTPTSPVRQNPTPPKTSHPHLPIPAVSLDKVLHRLLAPTPFGPRQSTTFSAQGQSQPSQASQRTIPPCHSVG